MVESHQIAIEWLVMLIGLIVLLIFLPFILKAFKSKNKEINNEPSAGSIISEIAEEKNVSQTNPIAQAAQNQIQIQSQQEIANNLDNALKKTNESIFGRIKLLFNTENQVTPIDEIEEILYTSDIGPQTVGLLMEKLNDKLSKSEKKNLELIKATLKEEILNIFNSVKKISVANSSGEVISDIKNQTSITSQINWSLNGPTVIMIVGVNGAGKTTTIGKLSALFAGQGKKILVAAGDTFRAAAQSQLKVWTDRAQVEIFSPEGILDPSAVAFDAVAKAKAQNYDLVLIDTAGRLHTQTNLMEELKKVKRVIQKNYSDAPHEILIVLDSNSGQNALVQAKEFNQALQLTGVVMTKLDGTAKGGVAIGVGHELNVPIKIIGIGEKIEDLKPFSAQEYVEALFS